MEEKVILKIRSEENVGDFYLPSGNEDRNNELIYFVDIFDRLGLTFSIPFIRDVKAICE